MKSDISRQTFDSRKHYSRVLMQQGRVQLDADWNEQQDILLHRIETQSGDTIGPSGVSADTNGFEVMYTPDGSDLLISPGSIYVDGVLCELEEQSAIDVQTIKSGQITLGRENVDNAPFKKGYWIELLLVLTQDGQIPKDAQTPTIEQWLGLLKISEVNDQDQQVITLSFDNPNFTISAPTKNKFKIRPVMTYLTQPNYPQPDPRMSGLPTPDKQNNKYVFLAYLDVWQRQISAFNDPDIREVALGGADTAQRSQTLWQIKIEPVEITSENLLKEINADTGKLTEAQRNELGWRMHWLLPVSTSSPRLSDWKAPDPPYSGKLSVRTTTVNGSDTPTYQGSENQLYHVEIHEGSEDESTPTFKWARNNASSLVAAQVEQAKASSAAAPTTSDTVTVQGSGQGSLLGLTVGQYVELVNEQTELNALPGQLVQIKQVDDITGQLTLDPPVSLNAQQTRLRLWNGKGPIDGSQDLTVSDDGWIALEEGIEIKFTQDGTYRSGDYWLIPARTATQAIEWPYTTPQPPLGIQHHYARLACLLHTQSIWLQQDGRRRFSPLAANALHILDINWRNDILNPQKLLKDGLYILLDGEPDQACAGAMQAAMIVSVETALPGGGAGVFLMSGLFEINANVISWHWNRDEKEGLLAKFAARFDEFRSDLFATYGHYQRVRITLKGHHIWSIVNGRRIYLDGQTFGMPGTVASGHIPTTKKEPGPHIALQFPSGAGSPASDFESWFYIKE